jgi:hypothetical protein
LPGAGASRRCDVAQDQRGVAAVDAIDGQRQAGLGVRGLHDTGMLTCVSMRICRARRRRIGQLLSSMR